MQLHDVIGIVEELRHEGKLVGNGFRIAAAHARDAGAVLHVTSNRRVNVKKSNRPKYARVRAFMQSVEGRSTVEQLNGWFKTVYGSWSSECDRAFGDLGDGFSKKFDIREHLGLTRRLWR